MDDRNRHLNSRCGPESREVLLALDNLVRSNFSVTGPDWSADNYVAYRVNGSIWLKIRTWSSILGVRFFVTPGTFTKSQLALRLGIIAHDKQISQADKLSQASAVEIDNRSSRRDEVALKLRPDYDVANPELLNVLKEAYRAFPG